MNDLPDLEVSENGKIIVKNLLERPYPEGYVEEWSELVKQGKYDDFDEKLCPVFIFRVHDEWLALPVKVVKDVLGIKRVHSIPHRMNNILKGTVNVEGHLKLLVSLKNILQISPSAVNTSSNLRGSYMCLISLGGDDWVITVHEIYGIRRIALSSLENVPVTVSKSTANFLKGIFKWDNKSVGYIEEELLFYSLKRRACD